MKQTAELVRQVVDDLTKQTMERYHDAVERRLSHLVADGVAISRIRLQRHMGHPIRTVVIVDDIPVAEFSLTALDDAGKSP